ncbi:Kelch repeat-containing protein [Marivirga arenosa]|uniref:IPT/TIG domain-containing protein n=1 Tax=Marivirga arenosa TaxID=3059076 RepID=A0AA51ZX80_9BACT|nr:hypothetical protein [Marivirga sp. BKB1-2]WNB18453.1 hypothetical protein QYS47_30245 [Marivirga sp. BKB1-2]
MKKINYLLLLLLNVINFSCNTDNSEEEIFNPKITYINDTCFGIQEEVKLGGTDLDVIDEIKIGSETIRVLFSSPDSNSFKIPLSIATGEYNLILKSTDNEIEYVYPKTIYVEGLGNWSLVNSDFPGEPRNSALSFVIDKFLYFGGDGSLSDFWKLNLETSEWTQLSDFDSGVTSSTAVNNTEGYVINTTNDFYKYSPETDSWVELASIPNRTAYYTLASVNEEIFALVGNNNDESQLWAYSKAEDSWRLILGNQPNIGQSPRLFVIDETLYAGFSNSSKVLYKYNNNENEFIEYLSSEYYYFGFHSFSSSEGFLGEAWGNSSGTGLQINYNTFVINMSCNKIFEKRSVPIPTSSDFYTAFTYDGDLYVGLNSSTNQIFKLDR